MTKWGDVEGPASENERRIIAAASNRGRREIRLCVMLSLHEKGLAGGVFLIRQWVFSPVDDDGCWWAGNASIYFGTCS